MSERERDVLAFSMEGMTTREIGEKLRHLACGCSEGAEQDQGKVRTASDG